MKYLKGVLIIIASASIFLSGCNKEAAEKKVSDKLPEAHPKIDSRTDIKIAPGSIKKASKGYTVEECYTRKKQLNGKNISVRGRVVKFNPDIMSRNWLHVQDGTGKAGENDLTVTTIGNVKVGQTVLVTGKLSVDKEFGASYSYPVILEGATVKIER